MNKIEIHYDFSLGQEVSYKEGMRMLGTSFCTHCLDFFSFDNVNKDQDVVVVRSDGSYISAKEMIEKRYKYCVKEIRRAHNIQKMLISGVFNWCRRDEIYCEELKQPLNMVSVTDYDIINEGYPGLSKVLFREVNKKILKKAKDLFGEHRNQTMAVLKELADQVILLLPNQNFSVNGEEWFFRRSNAILARATGRPTFDQDLGIRIRLFNEDKNERITWFIPITDRKEAIMLEYISDIMDWVESTKRPYHPVREDFKSSDVGQRIIEDGLGILQIGQKIWISLGDTTLYVFEV